MRHTTTTFVDAGGVRHRAFGCAPAVQSRRFQRNLPITPLPGSDGQSKGGNIRALPFYPKAGANVLASSVPISAIGVFDRHRQPQTALVGWSPRPGRSGAPAGVRRPICRATASSHGPITTASGPPPRRCLTESAFQAAGAIAPVPVLPPGSWGAGSSPRLPKTRRQPGSGHRRPTQ